MGSDLSRIPQTNRDERSVRNPTTSRRRFLDSDYSRFRFGDNTDSLLCLTAGWHSNYLLFHYRYGRAKRLVAVFPREERDRESLYFDPRPREERDRESPREGEKEPSSQCCIG